LFVIAMADEEDFLELSRSQSRSKEIESGRPFPPFSGTMLACSVERKITLAQVALIQSCSATGRATHNKETKEPQKVQIRK
jgi:hypothetical protein